MKDFWNFENSEKIICPYCGREYEPSYEDTYIKSFILFGDESLRYYFTETNKDKVTVTEKRDYKPREVRPIGRFGRLNDMTSLKDEALAIAMKEFATEKQLADDIFVAY